MTSEGEKKKPVKIWVDGCFDMMHFGHANALRQAKSLGDYLIVGVHSDEAILKNKGPTVMKEQERYKAVRACKWVDEVVEDAPYVTQLSWMDRYGADFCVHGDDLVLSADGSDCYAEVKAANRFKVVKRTKGVSTTDLVGRMLLLTKTHWVKKDSSGNYTLEKKKIQEFSETAHAQQTRVSNFLATANRLVQFSSGKEPKPTDKIVYIDGAFDLFHVGHVDILREARAMGDYLIVGLLDDETVNRYLGGNLPIMNLHERALSVLSCRYVDEVVIGAPLDITNQMIENFHISLVVSGSQPHSYGLDQVEGYEPYKVPKQLGIFHVIPSPSRLTTTEVIKRILANHAAFEERNKKKEEKERNANQGVTFTT